MHLYCGQFGDSCDSKVTLSRVYPHAKDGTFEDHKPENSKCRMVLFNGKVKT
jgi:hypothetical protein